MKEPLVSICCITYNQEKYVRECLEGFVMQKTNFPYEIVISDDCSKDGTRAVIAEYKEKYPDLFRDISPEQNKGSMANFLYVQAQAKGKYVALCEGDDYWIDPLKLQKQVDYMESHPDYSMCFTNSYVLDNSERKQAINYIWDTYTIEDIIGTNALNSRERGDNIESCGHTSSLLYRCPKVPLPQWITKCFIGDEPLFIALGQYGKAKLINEEMTVYRIGVGISSKDFRFETEYRNRIKMYEIINEGLNYKYQDIIKPIIAELYYRLYKMQKSERHTCNALSSLWNVIKTDKSLFLKKIYKR